MDIRAATNRPALIEAMERKACDLAPTLRWISVAGQYPAVCPGLVELRQQMTA
jgi:hypothetical protein